MWIARDKDNKLYLYSEKPKRTDSGYTQMIPGYLFVCGEIDEENDINNPYVNTIELNSKAFPEITFENSPKKLFIK